VQLASFARQKLAQLRSAAESGPAFPPAAAATFGGGAWIVYPVRREEE